MKQPDWRRVAAATAPAALVAVLAVRRQALSPGGALAATLTGGVIGTAGGWPWSVALLTFFVSSSALSRLKPERKAALAAVWEKGSRRDAGQVAANGGVAGLTALWHLARPTRASAAALYGALATSTADTWATELGVLQHAAPRLITTGKPVPRGTSGAVSGTGTLATIAGSALMGAMALLGHSCGGRVRRLLAITAAGVAGSLADSLLGATLQAAYYCPTCQAPTERRVHACGTIAQWRRGLPWMTNDVVNFLATVVGALVALIADGLSER